jgi:hypothetical protein
MKKLFLITGILLVLSACVSWHSQVPWAKRGVYNTSVTPSIWPSRGDFERAKYECTHYGITYAGQFEVIPPPPFPAPKRYEHVSPSVRDRLVED